MNSENNQASSIKLLKYSRMIHDDNHVFIECAIYERTRVVERMTFSNCTPVTIVKTCMDVGYKMLFADYIEISTMCILAACNTHRLPATREIMNEIVYRMQEENDIAIDRIFDSDNYPLHDDLIGVLI